MAENEEETMVRRHAILVALSLALGLAVPAAAEEKPAASPAGAAAAKGPDFKAMMRKTLDAWETLDPAKAAPFYSDEAGVHFFDLAPLKYTGWKEYEAGTKQVFQDFATMKVTLNPDARVEQHGAVAWGTATARFEVTKKDGSKLPPLDARWTLIWEKKGSKWLIAHEHVSTPLPDEPEKKK